MKALALLALPLLLLPGVSRAGPYADDLSKCLVSSTTSADKSLLVKWMFSAIALNEDVAQYVDMPKEARDALNKDTAGLYMRLMTETCGTQLRDAFKYEGEASITTAFQMLGQVASQEMFDNPAVMAGMDDLSKHFDEAKLKAVLEAK
jgi:hypothetical protein